MVRYRQFQTEETNIIWFVSTDIVCLSLIIYVTINEFIPFFPFSLPFPPTLSFILSILLEYILCVCYSMSSNLAYLMEITQEGLESIFPGFCAFEMVFHSLDS